MKLAIVTATTDLDRSRECRLSWTHQGAPSITTFVVVNGWTAGRARGWRHSAVSPARWTYWAEEILGTVPAFAIGVQKALEEGAEIIACFHDDLLIEQQGWDLVVQAVFTQPTIGLVGFGGATGLGHPEIYQLPYDPMQLARYDFRSNMRDAEAHGLRETQAIRVACLDGFSQIGRAEYWRGQPLAEHDWAVKGLDGLTENLFTAMQTLGVVHHLYDGMLGCYAKRLGWEVWMLPIACHHFGGQTAVGDARYHAWANVEAQKRDRLEGITEEGIGDQVFWQQAHAIGYDHFRDVLPIRV